MSLNKHSITSSHYGFSAARIDSLGAAEYTLVTIAADVSGSVSGFEREIERCIKEVVSACRCSPRADNLMARTLMFDSALTEIHGFKPLANCQPADYDGCLRIGGTTALYDAAHNAVEAVSSYGKQLSDADFDVNGIVFVITDGGDNASRLPAKSVNQALRRAVRSEALESMVSILVGVNIQDASVSGYLSKLHKSAGFNHYLELGDADAATLAQLADFVSRSINAQSRALGSGHSASLSF